MADIRITDLPVADYQRPTDVFAFQRLVAGVPTDFRTYFGTVSGDVQLAIVSWDMATPISQTIVTPAAGEIAVYLDAYMLYTADGTPGGGTFAVYVYDGVPVNLWASVNSFSDATDGAFAFADIGGGPVNTMGTGISLGQSAGPNVDGSATVVIQYLILRL